MAELLTLSALSVLLISFAVGIVVGLTGMGGGALMTPALHILLGIPLTTAIANDLVAAAAYKSGGAAMHWRQGSPNLKLAGLLIVSSVPFAFAGPFLIEWIGGADTEELLKLAVGVALLIAASTYMLRMYLQLRHVTSGNETPASNDVTIRPARTMLIGAVGGLLVGITSVGSGSLIMVSMLLLYPTLSALKLVGTDLVQAVPLVLAAAIGHVIVSGVDWDILIPLILGGTPGTLLGARIAGWVNQSVLRRGIVIVLSLTGLTLLGVPSEIVGLLGAAMLLLGPLVWGFIRQTRGLPAFDNNAAAWRLPEGRRSD